MLFSFVFVNQDGVRRFGVYKERIYFIVGTIKRGYALLHTELLQGAWAHSTMALSASLAHKQWLAVDSVFPSSTAEKLCLEVSHYLVWFWH